VYRSEVGKYYIKIGDEGSVLPAEIEPSPTEKNMFFPVITFNLLQSLGHVEKERPCIARSTEGENSE
jgi:hypothetical protein